MIKGSIFCWMVQAFCLYCLSSQHFLSFTKPVSWLSSYCFLNVPGALLGTFSAFCIPSSYSGQCLTRAGPWIWASPCWNFLKENKETHTHTAVWFISHKARFMQFKKSCLLFWSFSPLVLVLKYIFLNKIIYPVGIILVLIALLGKIQLSAICKSPLKNLFHEIWESSSRPMISFTLQLMD